MTLSEKELQYAEQNELNRRFVQNAIEMALSFGDFQKEIDTSGSPGMILSEAATRIERLISFEVSALYLVDEESSDLHCFISTPDDSRDRIDNEVAFLIDNGYLAWAMRERRGVSVYSKDGSQQILLHVLATYARIRGLFIGFFPSDLKRLPNASKEILSIILRNTANSLESLACQNLLKQQKSDLEHKVAEKTHNLMRLERQLMQAQKMEAIVALAGGVAHQFSNALTGLIGNIDLLALGVDKTEELSHFIERTRPITERMTHLTNQLLTYAQGGNYNPRAVPLEELVNSVLPVLRRAVNPAIRLETEHCDLGLIVKVDVTQLQMVVSAIVNNADEAMDGQGSIRIVARKKIIDVAADDPRIELEPGKYACLSIRDTGKGMDPNTVRRLFEPFFTTKFEGRGLSMASVFGIIKNHQGWIQVDSSPGQGTQVDLYLPLDSGQTPLA